MAINYTWKILEMDVIPDLENPPNKIISTVYYNLVGEENEFKGVFYGTERIEYHIATGIPFEILTESDVIQLIKNNLANRDTGIYEFIESAIQNNIFPVTDTVPLPWVAA